jgi:uncharacterized membrane protein
MMRHVWPGVVCVALAVAVQFPSEILGASQAKFYSLGDLPGGEYGSYAYGVSGDGETVVGYARSTGRDEAIIWSELGGLQKIGGTPDNLSTIAWSVSDDGSAIAGISFIDSRIPSNPFRWTTGEGFQALSGCGCSGLGYRVTISGNGSTIVGTHSAPGLGVSAFRWNDESGPQDLGDFPGGNHFSAAFDATSDGETVVGVGSIPGGAEGFRWTEASGLQGLGQLMYQAQAVSADGTTIAGAGFLNGQGAVRWTEAEGPVWLGHLPGLTGTIYSFASDISADGAVIVGGSGEDARFQAFRWTAESGMRSVQEMLQELGVDTSGWRLGEASGVSADGSVIIGNGVNPNGDPEGWVAVIPASYVPEPGVVSLLAGIVSVLSFGRNNCRRLLS